ncbi:hypothetical protein PR048_024257 [Dryococelus australis]|uniref:Uncharacterized protein n=1 Tax=Dryococelus australis TaxID=614101 RepID=A0ABQ9GN58_9NEOP|nr:hypothetical protein PR048_024257 [Dryococelus australis]
MWAPKVKKRGSDTGDTNMHAQRLIAPTRKACSVRPNAARETGDPRENSLTSGIIRHDSHMRKSGTRSGIEHGSPCCDLSSLTAQPPRPLCTISIVMWAAMAQWLERTLPTKPNRTTLPPCDKPLIVGNPHDPEVEEEWMSLHACPCFFMTGHELRAVSRGCTIVVRNSIRDQQPSPTGRGLESASAMGHAHVFQSTCVDAQQLDHAYLHLIAPFTAPMLAVPTLHYSPFRGFVIIAVVSHLALNRAQSYKLSALKTVGLEARRDVTSPGSPHHEVLQAPSRTVGFTRRFHTLSSIQATNTSLAVVPQSPVVDHTSIRSRALGQAASIKDCRPLGCGSIYSVLGRHLESSPTRVMYGGGLRRQPVSPEHSCAVAKRIGNSSRREEVCDACKSRHCRHSRDSQKVADSHERIFPGRGEDEVGLRLRHTAAESAPAAAQYSHPTTANLLPLLVESCTGFSYVGIVAAIVIGLKDFRCCHKEESDKSRMVWAETSRKMLAVSLLETLCRCPGSYPDLGKMLGRYLIGGVKK